MKNEDHFYISYPQEGMKIKTMLQAPSINVLGYTSCGTWKKENGEYILIAMNWQDKKGNIISNEVFLSLALTS
jgi:hypothetical protein